MKPRCRPSKKRDPVPLPPVFPSPPVLVTRTPPTSPSHQGAAGPSTPVTPHQAPVTPGAFTAEQCRYELQQNFPSATPTTASRRPTLTSSSECPAETPPVHGPPLGKDAFLPGKDLHTRDKRQKRRPAPPQCQQAPQQQQQQPQQ